MFWDEVSGYVLRPKFELGGYYLEKQESEKLEMAGCELGEV